ncbi:toll/interleukin-1 receptor domain-containing protein [Leptolyngbya sp. FACHB-671]|uniref:effector-associated domain EAD1-containing protein n=1 Tax=Leptolyngbya sp. FACHB-671 TaxID=2692812 RepID=UPI00168529ED|nr:effector-associated domain EAD1-containing protein [Leptolyngbya sp. FACHB-671]MBD2066235.1 toll/interleukin-1 receptor domain-containing protein [Leptolyngbya sp. FACHB-671]
MPPLNAIFISYRRSDSNDVTGRIYDRLAEHFGREVVFKDVHSIPFGVNFRTHLKQEVGRCQVLIAVIGPTWLEVLKQRLNQSQDWVRTEIAVALERAIPVIPLLVGGAQLPSANDLPSDLQELAYRNAAHARPDPDFHQDMNRLIRGLEEIVGLPEPSVSPNLVSLLSLTVEQRKELRAALISAFPRQTDLELMIEDELGESFNLVTQGQPNYEFAVRDLVKWAEAQGKVQSFLEGAVRSNPGNPKLQELAKLWLKQ